MRGVAGVPRPGGRLVVVDFHPLLWTLDDQARWNLSEVITAVLDAGLTLKVFHEHPFINGGKPFPKARPLPGGRWTTPDGVPALPLMYGLAASKPGA
jgi:hypothetical protein